MKSEACLFPPEKSAMEDLEFGVETEAGLEKRGVLLVAFVTGVSGMYELSESATVSTTGLVAPFPSLSSTSFWLPTPLWRVGALELNLP